MSIPLPGAGFVYSLLKDVGRWCWTRLRGRCLPRVETFQQWTVEQWYREYAAIGKFGDQDLVQRRDEAWKKWAATLDLVEHSRKVGEDLALDVAEAPDVTEAKEELDRVRHEQGERYDRFHWLLSEDLHDRLLSGELLARGFREPFSHAAPYLTISRHEWRIIKITDEFLDRAEGGGVAYVGLTIGKPGTKRFLRRRK